MTKLELLDTPAPAEPAEPTKPVEAHRFPRPRFPASVYTVPAMLLVVALIAAGALAMLRSPAVPEPPPSAPAELHAAAAQAASAFAAPADQLVRSVTAERVGLSAGKAKEGRKALRRIAHLNQDVEGLVLFDRGRGKVVADRGEDLRLPPVLPTPADGTRSTLTDDRVVIAVPVNASRVLVGTLPLRAPRLGPDQRVLLVRPDGGITAQTGNRPDAPAGVVQAVADGVAKGQNGFAVDTQKLVPTRGASLLTIDPADHAADQITAAGGVPVPGAAATSGLQAVVVRALPLSSGVPTSPGGLAAVIVGGAGLVGFLVLLLGMVRPIRRLRDDIDSHVDDMDSGRPSSGRFRRSRLRPVDRVARFMTGFSGAGPAPSRLRAGIGGVGLLVVVAAVMLAALATGFAAVHTHQAARTDVLVERSRAMVEDTAGDLEHTLTEGLASVQSVAAPKIGDRENDWDAKLHELLADRSLFRSVYVRDAAGNIVASAGDAPRADHSPAAPVEQLNDAGAEPIVVASASVGDGQSRVIAEFDPRALNTVLRGADRPTSVYDAKARTVLGSDGYVSFSPLEDPGLHRTATDATVAPAAVVVNVAGNDELVATRRLGASGATAALGWVVLQDRGVTAARYTVDPVGRATTVIVGLAALGCLGLLAWSYVTTIKPLQKLTEWLDADGHRQPCPAPRRLDEVGAVMSGVAHCLKRGERA